MRTLKTFLVSAAVAASTLGFVAVSGPAQACFSCTGIKLNGIELNGMRINGVRFNGMKVNGLNWNGVRLNCIKWNGMKINGIRLNGAQQTGTGNEAKTVRVLAVTLPE